MPILIILLFQSLQQFFISVINFKLQRLYYFVSFLTFLKWFGYVHGCAIGEYDDCG